MYSQTQCMILEVFPGSQLPLRILDLLQLRYDLLADRFLADSLIEKQPGLNVAVPIPITSVGVHHPPEDPPHACISRDALAPFLELFV